MIGDDLDLVEITHSPFTGLVYAAGLDSGFAWLEYSDDLGATKGSFLAGGTRRIVSVEVVGNEQPGITVLPNGFILIAVTQAGLVRVYGGDLHGWYWQLIGAVE